MMHNPPHPGIVLHELCLKPLNLSVDNAAELLGVKPEELSEILDGRQGIDEPMAIRLAIAFDTSFGSWLRQQMQFDLWHSIQKANYLYVEHIMNQDEQQQ